MSENMNESQIPAGKPWKELKSDLKDLNSLNEQEKINFKKVYEGEKTSEDVDDGYELQYYTSLKVYATYMFN